MDEFWRTVKYGMGGPPNRFRRLVIVLLLLLAALALAPDRIDISISDPFGSGSSR